MPASRKLNVRYNTNPVATPRTLNKQTNMLTKNLYDGETLKPELESVFVDLGLKERGAGLDLLRKTLNL